MKHLAFSAFVALVCMISVFPISAQDAPRPMTIVDLINVPGVGDPQISPDGNQFLYVRTDVDWDNNTTRSHIWRVNNDGSGTVQMTNGKNSESSPRWSADGSEIAFLTERGEDEHSQVYLIPNDGGEARVLTNHATGVSSIQWSPDGQWVYFTAREEQTEAEKGREEVNDNVFRFEEDEKNTHLWRALVEDGSMERLTEGEFSVRDYEISSDGGQIVLHQAPTPLYDDVLNSEIWIMMSDGSEPRQLTSNTIGESGALLSPDNSTVLFLADANEAMDDYYYNQRMFTMPASGGRPELVLMEAATM